jgi:hypothetical protein
MATQKQAENADIDPDATWRDFNQAVNMEPAELSKWLDTPESKSVGFTPDGEHESVGHDSGRKILAIKHKKKTDLSHADYEHMRKVIGYVHRHMAQGGPERDKPHSRWRYSLMNWGHDPLKT